jgi:hypothetical protein
MMGMIGYLDQLCFDLAEIRILDGDALDRAGQLFLECATLEAMPRYPVWIEPDDPQPFIGLPDANGLERRVAALFLRAPFASDVLRRALVPPIVERPWGEGDQSPLWYDWRLDLIDPAGRTFPECTYWYDLRVGKWQVGETHVCPWDACVVKQGAPGEDPSVQLCQQCHATMDYYTRWLATVLKEDVGKILLIAGGPRQNEQRVRAQPGVPGADRRGNKRKWRGRR